MLGLQFTMAVLAYRIRSRRAELSDAFLDEILPIIEDYHGPESLEGFGAATKKIRSLSEEQRTAVYRARRKPNVSLGLRQYSIPLFATQVADLAICSLDFQRAVLHIRYHLDL